MEIYEPYRVYVARDTPDRRMQANHALPFPSLHTLMTPYIIPPAPASFLVSRTKYMTVLAPFPLIPVQLASLLLA